MSRPEHVRIGHPAAPGGHGSAGGRRFGRRALVRAGVVVWVGLIAGLLAWLLLVRPNDDAPNAVPVSPSPAVPVIASVADLRALADSGERFYWAGVRGGTKIELTVTDGTVFIRYLPPGEPSGSSTPLLTVATYPRANGFEEVTRASEGGSVTAIDLPRGGLAVVDETTGTNVHLAYPDESYQVEVYAPEAGVARRLVANGTVRAFS
jgi:hypothetical protein